MQFQNDSDIRQLKQRSGGGVIAVGLPFDSGIFIQEYWTQGIPHYAIANASTEAATISIVEWNREPGRQLLGHWTVLPGTVQHYDIQNVVDGYAGSLVCVSLNETPVYGLLKSPQPPSEPFDWDKADGILTTYGLNGIGDRHSNLQCLQEEMAFDSGQICALTLKIQRDAGIITFKSAKISQRLPQAMVESVTSVTLSVEQEGDSYIIGRKQTPGFHLNEVRLSVRLPLVEAETMAALWGHVSGPSGAGYAFGRGLIVRPGR